MVRNVIQVRNRGRGDIGQKNMFRNWKRRMKLAVRSDPRIHSRHRG